MVGTTPSQPTETALPEPRADEARQCPSGLLVSMAVLVVVLVAMVATLTAAGPAHARTEPAPTPSASPTSTPAPAPATGKIVGRVVGTSGAGIPRARVALFDMQWRYVRDTVARSTGRFSFSGVAPDRYRLQVTDTRAAWRTDLIAPTDARTRVRKDRTSVLTVAARKGAFLTGRVTRGPQDKAARRALVRVGDAYGRTYKVKADKKGYFAVGGLTKGTFRVWAEDPTRRWAGSTTVVRGLTRAKSQHLALRLRTRAGGVNGFVLEGSTIAQHTTWVTAVHRRTGQWRVVKVRNGDLSVRGLLPGRYDFSLTATSTHAGRTIKSGTKVRPGRTKHVTLRLGKKLR